MDNRGREPRLEVETFSLHWIPKTIVVATRNESQLVAFFASGSCRIQNNRTLPIENAKFFQGGAAWNVHFPVEKNETIASFDRKYRSNLSWGAISFEQCTYFVPQQKSVSFAILCSGIERRFKSIRFLYFKINTLVILTRLLLILPIKNIQRCTKANIETRKREGKRRRFFIDCFGGFVRDPKRTTTEVAYRVDGRRMVKKRKERNGILRTKGKEKKYTFL